MRNKPNQPMPCFPHSNTIIKQTPTEGFVRGVEMWKTLLTRIMQKLYNFDNNENRPYTQKGILPFIAENLVKFIVEKI